MDSKASVNGYRIMRILALIASLIIAVQIIAGLAIGSIICPNDGCKVLESLTGISSLYLNVLGLIFFQIIFWLSDYLKKKSLNKIDLLGLLLNSGLAFGAVLLAYQIFFARAFCSYCILVFLFVLMLNLIYGRKQMVTGTTILAVIVFSFSILNFFPTEVLSRLYSLKNAAYGIKSCASPTKEIYLIFSSDCPHCKNVIQALENCNSCDLYLNPIEKIDSLNFEDLKLNPDFSPDINRLILKVLGIDSVPVLVSKNESGYQFIKGENRILEYVSHACFTQDDVLYFDDSVYSGQEGITAITEQEGECSVEIDCNK